jgi:ribonuclease HepT-like protein
VSDRLRKQIATEREQLNRLIETHRSLLDKCANDAPSEIELSAIASMLHAFYTGIENIFKRVTLQMDGALPGGMSWHRALLDAMSLQNDNRAAVISEALRERLKDYLKFRHVFRHAYSFQLQWEKMSSLTLDCENTLRMLERDLDNFLPPEKLIE